MENVSSSNGLEKRPKLRFPGFDEPWKAEKLSDFAERVTRKNTNNETSLPLTISSKDGLVDQISYFNKTVASKDMSGYYLLKNGEYAYNKSYSVGYDFGSVKRLDRYDMGALSTLYICFALKKHDSDFIKAYFDSLKWYREIYMISAEGARNHGLLNVPTDEFFDTKHYIPMDLAEQRKIANFMIALERRIVAQQSLVDNLKKYKRGLLRKVFAKLSDSCEKRNLKEVSVLFADGDWIESKDQALDGIRLIQTGNVGFGVYIDKTQNAKYISETTFHRLNCLEIYDGDILISRLPEPAGRACLLPKSTERRITAVDCTVIRTDSSVIDRNYLLQFLCSEQYLKTVNSFLAGGTRQRISRKNLEGIEVPYPSIDEQRYWGSFLCKVDARISNEEQRRSSLSRLRCFMLQQLFI